MPKRNWKRKRTRPADEAAAPTHPRAFSCCDNVACTFCGGSGVFVCNPFIQPAALKPDREVCPACGYKITTAGQCSRVECCNSGAKDGRDRGPTVG